MNKLEELPKEIYFDELQGSNGVHCLDYSNGSDIRYIREDCFKEIECELEAVENQLTLDSKIKDGEPVEEPIEIIYECEPPQSQIDLVEEYHNLPTLGESLKELEQLKCYVNTVQKPSVERYEETLKQIEQLTKENESLRERNQKKHDDKENAISSHTQAIISLQEQLQAEKQKVKEMVIKSFNDGKRFQNHGGANTTGAEYYKTLNQLINKE